MGLKEVGSHDPCLTEKYPKAVKIDGKHLKLTGFILDEIDESTTTSIEDFIHAGNNDTTPFFLGGKHSPIGIQRVQAIGGTWRYTDGGIYKATGEDLLDATLSALYNNNIPGDTPLSNKLHKEILKKRLVLAGRFADRSRPDPDGSHRRLKAARTNLITLGGAIKMLPSTCRLLLQSGGKDLSDLDEALHRMLMEVVDTSLFRTRRGYIGKSNSLQVQKGDRIALVCGAAAPLILRPRTDGLWKLVAGDSYVHGIANGEAFDIDKCHEICIA